VDSRTFLSRCRAVWMAGLLAGVLLAVFGAPLARALTPDQAERAHALSLRLKCMCGGCDDTVGTCNHSGGAFAGPCETAQAEMKEIDQRIARGESDGLILQDFVQEYGPSVLVTPPAKGFNWLVWIMPVVLPLVAVLLVWQVVRRWRRRAEVQPVAASGPPVSAELLERARRESEKDSDE
jgi:cytochrome c-type biogenesis protein CcmH/NrfF